MEEDIRIYKQLWDDYLTLCDKYRMTLPPPRFGFEIISHTIEMLIDTHPSNDAEAVLEVVKSGIKAGMTCYIMKKENSK